MSSRGNSFLIAISSLCFFTYLQVPIIILDALNWEYDTIWHGCILDSNNNNQITHIKNAWTGEYQDQIFNAALCYFLMDTMWVLVVPKCVRSPGTIVVHHMACLVYLYLVYIRPEFFWFMGACLTVEVNTWFLIARRVVSTAYHGTLYTLLYFRCLYSMLRSIY